MTGDEVDAAFGALARAPVEIGAATDAAGEEPDHSFVTAPETAYLVAISSVPLCPTALREAANLIRAPCIPCLGDDLHLSQDWVLGDALEQRGVKRQVTFFVPAQDGGQIEAETIHVHLHHPVAKRGQDEVSDHRVIRIDAVPGPSVVPIEAPVLLKHIEDGIVQATQAEGRAQFIPLGGVSKDDVQDDLNTRLVEGLHHLLELQPLLAQVSTAGVGALRSHESDRIIAPVVPQPLAGQGIDLRQFMLVELLYGHQLHCRHAQVLQVGDSLRQPPVRTRMTHT